MASFTATNAGVVARQHTSIARKSNTTALQRQVTKRSVSRTSLVCRAEDKKPPTLDFAPTERAALGYTDEDSAGQSNIFAVEPQMKIARGAGDTSTYIVAAVGAAFAGAAVYGAFTLGGPAEELTTGATGEPLTAIYAKLSGSAAPWAPAPVVEAPVVEAPPVEVVDAVDM